MNSPKVQKIKQKRHFFKNDIFNHPLGKGSWKDFFIPHSGNDHKPHALHPKRALFHISIAFAIKGIVLLFVFQYPLTAWMTPDVSAVEATKVVTLTNNLRASVSAGNLAQNQKLNQAAYQKVQDMFLKQYFAHRSPTGAGLDYFAKQGGYTNYYVIGENLAVGYDKAETVMAAWQNSPTHYKNLVDPLYRDIGVSIVGGLYKDKDTVFIAQYFGSLQAPIASPSPSVTSEEPKTETSPSVLAAQKTETSPAQVTTTPTSKPVVTAKTSVQISQPAGKPNEKVVEVKATLPTTTTAAQADILNKTIALSPTSNGDWEGRDLITTDATPATVVPAALTIQDQNGESAQIEIQGEMIIPDQSSVLDQYALFKNHPNHWLNWVFSLSTWYYELMLVLAMTALALNIAVAHHKQHPHLIASGTAVMMSMFFLLLV